MGNTELRVLAFHSNCRFRSVDEDSLYIAQVGTDLDGDAVLQDDTEFECECSHLETWEYLRDLTGDFPKQFEVGS